ncbi:hypothetical protein T12_6014 [Trichinella patagoniensis]|uniref:Uncharacterized protein n=1 Tax=Trichinella patagoniensis TaxID=990121 RepID=A0A0V1AAZ8_9BILA|nr:hypothetical protein T12_6014 [Trichinella patagoniensis]
MPMDMVFTWSIGVQLCIIGFDKLDIFLKLPILRQVCNCTELLSHVQLDGKVSQSGFDTTPITKMEKKDFGTRIVKEICFKNIRQIYGEVGDAKRRCSLHLCSYYKNNLCELFY